VKLKLRWADFTTLTRQMSVGPTDDAALVAQAARWLLDQVWERGRAVRLIGVGVSGLEARARQLSLLDIDPQDAGSRTDACDERGCKGHVDQRTRGSVV
jgi:DNA polymerase-4